MLASIDGTRVTAVPYATDYKNYLARMEVAEIAAIKAELNRLIDNTEIQTAGWMPGSNWSGTVFHPIYEKAAKRHEGIAAKCFGLMVWEVFMERPEVWVSGRFEKDGEPLSSRTYFQPRPAL